MAKVSNDRRVSLLFYILTLYILVQFAWWAYLLIDLNKLYYSSQGADTVNLKIWMVLGEGAVFLTFLLGGIYIMQRTIRKEITLVRQQRNFLLSITHELKTPLAAIKLGIQTLQKRKNLSSDQREPLEKSALANTERLHNLIDNVLLATRIESGQHPLHLNPINISEKTDSICQETEIALGNPGMINREIEPGLTLNVDGNAYESILVNLIENAFKYGDSKGIYVSLKKEKERVLLSVEDNGRGIPPQEQKKIFEKFYRMGNEETRSKKGTGLGLFIVKELVTLHQGKITISDGNLKGARFTVSLPLS
ncbi:MAG TPA: HAMP domain-containing sensor histidine kinase [Cryomorphaceae bacterium]|nr:HAMP domain-containing sensor histidine kinase [Cryomorphaceae bacterium]